MAQRLNLKGIASYPHLFTPRAVGRPGQQQGEPRYSIVIILDDDNDWNTINGALAAEAAATFPQGWPNGAHWPLKQFTEQDAPKPEFVGKWHVNAKSDDQPDVRDREVMPIRDEREIYPGVRVIVNVAFAGFNNVQKGVGCYLNAVQKIGEGPRLDNRPTAQDVFSAQPEQNVAGYNPSAFPQGTVQNPAPQGQPGVAPANFGVPGQDPRAYGQPGSGGNGAAPGGMPMQSGQPAQPAQPGPQATPGALAPGQYPYNNQ